MTYLQKTKLATENLDAKLIDHQQWVAEVLGEDYRGVYSDEYLRRAAKVFAIFVKNLDDEQIETGDDEVELRKLLDDIKAEKLKVQTANLEYNAAQRAEARNDMFHEQLIAAVNRLEPINRQPVKYHPINPDTKTTALLAISDIHAGSTFEIKGMYGEVVNAYSWDIMCSRMWSLLDKIADDDLAFDDLTVAILGDCFENVLRDSSLTKLREPVVDTVIRFGEFMANWLVAVSEHLDCPINVVTIGGNHDVARLLTSRPHFEGENLTKIVVEFLKLRLAGFDTITVDDYQDVAIKTIRGTNIMFQHGEDKDLKDTLDYFCNLYNVDCDEILAGHLHRPESKAIGYADVGDRLLTRVGSIVGVDAFAKKIRVSARPSAYMAMYTDAQGKTWSRNYYL